MANGVSVPQGFNSLMEAIGGRTKQKREEALNQQFVEAFQTGDRKAIREMIIKNPELTDLADNMYEFKDKETKENAIQTVSMLKYAKGDIPRMKQVMMGRIQFLNERGVTGPKMQGTVSAFQALQQGDPTLAYNEMDRMESVYGDPKEAASEKPYNVVQDYVTNMNQASIDETGKPLTARQRGAAQMRIKRPQANEKYYNKLAERDATAETAQAVKFNGEMGVQLAKIGTTADLLKAQGVLTPVQKQENAKKSMTAQLSILAGYFTELDSIGAMVNVDNPTLLNMSASIRSSDLGQGVAKRLGTKEQVLRDKIKSIKPLLINDIRQASEMGVKGMDSEKELQFYLQAVGDEKLELHSNYAAIYVLARKYGNEELTGAIESKVDKGYAKYLEEQGLKIRQEELGVTEPVSATPEATATGPNGEKIGLFQGEWRPI